MLLYPKDYPQHDVSAQQDARNRAKRTYRPVGTLLHTTSGLNSLDWLLHGAADAGQPASSDYLIDRVGTVSKLTPDGYYPYHAGRSSLTYNNKQYLSDEVSQMLIGVEMECLDTEQVTWPQMDACANVIVRLGIAFGWRWPYYVIGHYEVARPVGRRSDPQGFAWGDFAGRLYAWSRAYRVPGLD